VPVSTITGSAHAAAGGQAEGWNSLVQNAALDQQAGVGIPQKRRRPCEQASHPQRRLSYSGASADRQGGVSRQVATGTFVWGAVVGTIQNSQIKKRK